MTIQSLSPQIRTTDFEQTIEFYTTTLGFTVDFRYEDFYAGLRAGGTVIHVKAVCDKDPSIDFVDEGGHLHLYLSTDDAQAAADRLKHLGVEFAKDIHETDWQTREFVIKDDHGHTIYFGQSL